jgi:hypothetical protein
MEPSTADKENISSTSSGRRSRLAVTSFVLGILSFLFLAGTLATPALSARSMSMFLRWSVFSFGH